MAEAADELVRIERKFSLFVQAGQALGDDDGLSEVTRKAAAARRAAEALYSIVEHVSGRDSVRSSMVLSELVGESDKDHATECGKLEIFIQSAVKKPPIGTGI